MEQSQLFLRFGTAIAIGFMIGLQREFAKQKKKKEIVAGERTFALLGLAGALAAMAADHLGSALAFFGVVLMLGLFTTVAYAIGAWRGHTGLTTEVAMLVAVLIGALCYWGYLTLAVALGIATTALLSLKFETDRFVRALTRDDIFAALQFAVITAIVLPVLPNESFLPPPFDVLNPFKIWLMVVFISGISFVGYLAIKFVGTEQGIGLTGFLGGMVSSTAVTLSFSERSNKQPELAKPFALAIMIAWTVMFSRVLIEVGVLNKTLLGVVWIPLVAAGGVGLLYGVYLFFSQRSAEKGDVEFSNPFDLGSAIKFGLLYGVVLLISRIAQMYFGDTGIIISSILSGIADVDAITLSMAELSNSGGLDLSTAARAIVVATMSNTLVKGGIAIMGGSKILRKALLPGIILIVIVGIGLTFLI
ncbi:MAG: MgtC/SapB family protein [Anaerolineales bacterium]|nr:MgtC/SapB family protein [Chloroflexota bacterium]MBL6982232.1 MgtC/SapB family protein [Anaerolineales bacterium]